MRLTWKRLGILAAGAAMAAFASAGTGLPATPHAAAAGPGTTRHRPIGFLLFENTNECGTQDASAIATGNANIECNYVTTTAINNAPGVNFTLTIAPAGTVFNAFIGPPLPPGCMAGGVGTSTVTISACTGGPIPAGTLFELGVTGGPAVGNITLTPAYNGGPPDPAITVPYQFETQNPPGPASIVTLGADPGTIASIVCSNTTPGKVAASPFFVGDTFSCLVTFSAPNSPTELTVDNRGLPASAPAFTLTGAQTDTAGFTYYTCGNAQTNTPCTSVTITGTFTAAGAGPGPSPIAFDIGAANLGANVFYLPPAVFSPASAPPMTGAGPGGAFVYAVQDTTVPTCTASADPNSLWPPNHKLTSITVHVTVMDSGSGVASVIGGTVSSNETQGLIDMQMFTINRQYNPPTTRNTFTVAGLLRAERNGNGDGRFYTQTITVTDAAGNASTCSWTVTVPHDQGH